MPLLHTTITLSGATRVSATRRPAVWVRIENETGNALVKVGNSVVTTTDYGSSVAAATAITLGGAPPANFDLANLYLLGTDTQKVHVSALLL